MATLYAARMAPDSLHFEDAEVIDEVKHGWAVLESAITLWRLVDPTRAEVLRAFIFRVADASKRHVQFAGDDLATLIQMISGVGDAIQAAGVIGRDGRVSAARLDELKQQVPAMDLELNRPDECKASALLEVICDVEALQGFLSSAQRAGCVVVHD